MRFPHPRQSLAVFIVFVAVTLGMFLYLFGLAGGLGAGDTRRIEAVVRDAVLLADRSDVRVAGVTVGRVEEVSNRGGTAVLGLEVERDVDVFRDATVRIGTKTPTGENYVDLDPGTARAPQLATGDVLGLRNARDAVQLDDLISELDQPRRTRLRSLIRGLGTGTGDHAQDLNGTLEGFAAIFARGAPMAEALAAERQAVAGLVDDLGTVLGALGTRDAALRALVRDGTAAGSAIAAEDDALRASLRRLPATQTAARGTTVQLASAGERLRPVLDDLGATLSALTPATRRLPATTDATRAALRSLRRAAPPAGRALRALRRTAPAAQGILGPVDEVLRQARPALDFNVPFMDDFVRGVSNIAGATNVRDGSGVLIRLTAVLSDSLYQGLTPEMRAMVDGLAAAGLTAIANTKFNGHPKAGRMAAPDDESAFRRLDADPQRGR